MIIVGVDPGIVHTGLVRVVFDKSKRSILRQCKVLDGLDMRGVEDWVEDTDDLVVVEKYNPRGQLGTNATMQAAEAELVQRVPGILRLDNMGILKTVPNAVLQTLGLWKFPVRTHHQDLRSAARILVKAMMQDTAGNKLLAEVVRDRVEGNPWSVGRSWIGE